MKTKLIILALISINATLFAQSTVPNTNNKSQLKNVISFNPGSISQYIFNINYPVYYTSSNEYLLMYRRFISNSTALRLGVNITNDKSKTTRNDTSYTTNNNLNYKIGLGIEHYVYLTKAWNFFYGADAQFAQNNYIYNYTNSNTETKQKSIGALGFIGLQVSFNSKLSLSLETGINAKSTVSNSVQLYNSVTTTTKEVSSNLNIISPQLQMRFKF